MFVKINDRFSNKKFLLKLVLLVFFLKGLVFAALLPAFQGADEPQHFRNAQYFSFSKNEPASSFNWHTEEVDFSQVWKTSFNTQNFTRGVLGIKENNIVQNTLRPATSGFPDGRYFFSPFTRMTSLINWLLGNENMLIRFFVLRIFSIILGVIAVYLIFLIFQQVGFSDKASFLLTAIFSFHPMLTNVTSIINYDAMLVLVFAFFAYSAIRLIKEGFSLKFFIYTILAVFAGLFTKGTGIILAGLMIPLFIYILWKKYRLNMSRFFIVLLVFLLISGILAYFFSPYNLNQIARMNKQSHFKTLSKSLSGYYSSTIGSFEKYSRSYWGDFGWISAPISNKVLRFIWIMEAICLIGLITFLMRKKNPDFLPKKKMVILLVIIFLALQFGIRFADWSAFNNRGHIIFGTFGRYFIPAFFAHLALLVIGAGVFAKREEIFNNILKIGLVLMVLLYFYSVLNIIIPRYYL